MTKIFLNIFFNMLIWLYDDLSMIDDTKRAFQNLNLDTFLVFGFVVVGVSPPD